MQKPKPSVFGASSEPWPDALRCFDRDELTVPELDSGYEKSSSSKAAGWSNGFFMNLNPHVLYSRLCILNFLLGDPISNPAFLLSTGIFRPVFFLSYHISFRMEQTSNVCMYTRTKNAEVKICRRVFSIVHSVWLFTGCSLVGHGLVVCCPLVAYWLLIGCSFVVRLGVHWLFTGDPLVLHLLFCGCAVGHQRTCTE